MKDTNLNIRINSELLNKAKIQAEKESRTLSNYIINLIKKDIGGNEMIGKKLSEKLGEEKTRELENLIMQYGGAEYHRYEIGNVSDKDDKTQIGNVQGRYNAVFNSDDVDKIYNDLTKHIQKYQKLDK